jgi:diacylglycerol kinase family enzyme
LRFIKINRFLEGSGFLYRWIYLHLYRSLYYLGGFFAAFNKKVTDQKYDITIDGEEISGNFRSINIANGPFYGGNKNPIRTAVPDDGILDILLGTSSGALRTMHLMHPYLKGRYEKFPLDFIMKQGHRITIHSDSPLLVNLDDEVFYDTSLTVEVIPQAVKIVDATGKGYKGRAEVHERP